LLSPSALGWSFVCRARFARLDRYVEPQPVQNSRSGPHNGLTKYQLRPPPVITQAGAGPRKAALPLLNQEVRVGLVDHSAVVEPGVRTRPCAVAQPAGTVLEAGSACASMHV
jgi:hypothetical protein